MGISEHFSAVSAILKESLKLLPRNGKYMVLIAFLLSLLYSSLFLFLDFSTMHLSSDMFGKLYNLYLSSAFSSSPLAIPFDSIIQDLRLLILVDVSFFLGIFLVSLFFTVTAVILSAASYSSKTLSSKDLVLQVVKSWKRAFITSFYLEILAIGYLFLVITMVAPLLVFSESFMLPVAIFVIVVVCILYLYLNVDWLLALVVSVMEENNYGIMAIGKAGILIKGKRILGFILNISLFMMYLILSLGFSTIVVDKKGMANQTVVWIFVSIFACLERIMLLVVYTVLYFHCKKEHGEGTELQGSVSYKKLTIEPPFSDAA